MLCCSEHVCSCHFHSGATWWKTTTCFPWLKQKAAFLGLLTSWLQSKQYEKSTAQTLFLHVNVCLMCPSFWCKMRLRPHHNSLMMDACQTFCHASLQIKSPTSTKLAAVLADRVWLLSTYCCWFYSATSQHWFCSTSYAEIPTAVVESKIRVVDFHQVAPICVIKLTNTELTNVSRTKPSWSVPKIMQTDSRVLKMWVVKCRGLGFLSHLDNEWMKFFSNDLANFVDIMRHWGTQTLVVDFKPTSASHTQPIRLTFIYLGIICSTDIHTYRFYSTLAAI